MAKTVLIVAAHTDDEALGCGGTIAKHVANGDAVFAVFLTDGVSSRPNSKKEQVDTRYAASTKAHRILGIRKSHMLGLPDNQMDSVPLLDIVQKIEQVMEEVQPQVVYTHHNGDLNIDHRITHQAVMTACRPVPGLSVKEIYAFEVLSATEWNSPGMPPFIPNVFVDVSDHIEVKMQAIETYALEMRAAPHSRSANNVINQAQYRGYSMGLHFAEAFSLIRKLL